MNGASPRISPEIFIMVSISGRLDYDASGDKLRQQQAAGSSSAAAGALLFTRGVSPSPKEVI
jgi:hypothetical protein